MDKIRKEEPGITEFCIKRLQSGDGSAIPDEKCYKFGPPQRMHGTWAAVFEGSQFCPGDAKSCDPGRGKPGMWLSFAEPVNLDWNAVTGGEYALDFIGRRTTYPGHYGHMGGWDQEVLVDRIISMKQLKAPPKH